VRDDAKITYAFLRKGHLFPVEVESNGHVTSRSLG